MCILYIFVIFIDSLSKIFFDKYDYDMLSRLEYCQKIYDWNVV